MINSLYPTRPKVRAQRLSLAAKVLAKLIIQQIERAQHKLMGRRCPRCPRPRPLAMITVLINFDDFQHH